MNLDTFVQRITNPVQHTKANRYKLTIHSIHNPINPDSVSAMYIKSFDLPGVSISTTELIDGTGPIRKIPYTTTYEDITFTVILTDVINPLTLRERLWNQIDRISPNDNIFGTRGIFRPLQYYEDVATDTLTIDTLSEFEDRLLNQTGFYKAYPIAVGAISYAYSNDEPATMDVTYAYEYWKPKHVALNQPFANM